MKYSEEEALEIMLKLDLCPLVRQEPLLIKDVYTTLRAGCITLVSCKTLGDELSRTFLRDLITMAAKRYLRTRGIQISERGLTSGFEALRDDVLMFNIVWDDELDACIDIVEML